MKLVITSASGNILSVDSFVRVTLMTEDGEVTVLSGHEPLLSAVRPGILTTEYHVGQKVHTSEYATGGGVLNISTDACTIVADVVEDGSHLASPDFIEKQKKEAEQMMHDFRQGSTGTVDTKRLMELEYEMLKYTAMQELATRFRSETTTGSRK